MSQYIWNEDKTADVQRLADAKLPEAFWKTLRALVGDEFEAKPITVELDGDVLTTGRSYIVVCREGKRIASLGMFTVRRAVKMADEAKAHADAAAKAKKYADSITWLP